MIVCAITIILIAILLSLFLFRKKKYSIGKKTQGNGKPFPAEPLASKNKLKYNEKDI